MSKISMLNKAESITFQEGFNEFITFCKVKNLSPATIESYNCQFRKITTILPFDTHISEIDATLIRNLVLNLQNQSLKVESINSCLRSLRAFMNYYHEMGYCRKPKVKLLKTEQPIKDIYTDDELKILLRKPDIKKCNFAEYRTWIVINFFIATGCRVRSLVNIRIADIDFENSLVKLTTTKNKKAQILPLSSSMLPILRGYLKFRHGEPNDYLFCSETGSQMRTTSLTKSVAAYNNRRGVLKGSVHLFRHTFARNFVLNGGDVFRLQKWLGHSTLDMSRRYANLFDSDLQHDFERYNLMERLSGNNQTLKLKK